MTDKLLNDLKVNIFYRAKVFIENIGEFAPFGAKLIENEIKDVVYYNEEDADIIDSQKAINILQTDFSKEIDNNLIQAGAVAFDVAINVENGDGKIEKRDALCLKISKDGKTWSEEYFPYMLINGECVWR